MKLTRLLRQRKTWMILVPVLAVILLLALIFGDPLSGSALEGHKAGIMGILILPVIATLYSYMQMMIDEQVRSRITGLLQEEEDPESPAASQARRAEADAAAEDEVASIAENLKTALATLRKRGIGGRGGRRL